MSDNIPFEIQTEVIKRVHPVKSLIRLRSVCKQWKSLIDSSEFITHHLLVNNNTQPHHLLIRHALTYKVECVSIVDDDDTTFPKHTFYPTVPPIATTMLMHDSSHGLVCFDAGLPSKLIVVWNPSIRKSVGIMPPAGTHIVGFGVCPNTSDVKIVAIKTDSTAEVFTLTTRIWRRIPMNLFSTCTSIIFSYNQVVVDGVVHWAACDWNEQPYRKRMFTFDLESEEFGEVALPDSLGVIARVDISRFKDSLAVIDYHVSELVCDVWVMFKNGVTKSSSFTKLFTVQHISFAYSVIGFRKNGQPILKLNDDSKETELQVYEPDSKHVNGLGIYGSCFDMINYTESLLLLNQSSDFIIR